MIELINGNCIDALRCIPDKSVDLILTDLPYGTTKNSWDTIIPLDALWAEWKRILRNDRTVALHSDMPFTATLYQQNPKWWKYEWIWEKQNGTNFLGCKKHPLKNHESIQIFQNGKTRYFPQYGIGKPYQSGCGGGQIHEVKTTDFITLSHQAATDVGIRKACCIRKEIVADYIRRKSR